MLYIRTDMNDVIATGHVMRCLAIADAAREIGENVTFLLADENAVSLISDRGYQFIVLNTSWNQMEEELEVLESVIKDNHIDKLLIDSYQVTEQYLYNLRKLVKIAYLDDGSACLYPVDLWICYGSYWKECDYKTRYSGTRLLLGLKYAPLRDVFCKVEIKDISTTVNNLLIMTGGTDRYNIVASLLDVINRDMFEEINVICGQYYKGYEMLCNKYQENKNIKIYKAINNIEEYMKKADVAITAGGTTLYELCAIGTPSISVSFADNQIDNVLQFASDELIDYAGDVRRDNVTKNVLTYLDSFTKEKRYECSRKMQELIDGLGAIRIAEELLKL